MPSVEKFFLDYAQALISYSPEKISSYYQVPFTVFADQGSQTVKQMDEVVAFWKEGVNPYASQGIMNAIPEIVSMEQMSETISAGKVLWVNFDKAGKEVGRETNFYILSKSSGQFKIIGLIIMSK